MQFKSKCVAAFGKCRKYEDAAGEVIGVCIRDPANITIGIRITRQYVDKAIKVSHDIAMHDSIYIPNKNGI